MTSAVVASVRKIAWPSGAFMSSVIERLLRLVKAWMVRRTHSSPAGRSGSGESILRTSAPMSASIMAGISAGGTRASSRILIPSRTPIALLLLRDEPRGERADVRHVLEAADLLGHALRGVGAQHRHGAAEELGVQLGVAERRRRMARGASAPRALAAPRRDAGGARRPAARPGGGGSARPRPARRRPPAPARRSGGSGGAARRRGAASPDGPRRQSEEDAGELRSHH